APLTLEARDAGVVVSGSEVWSGWAPTSANPWVYAHPWSAGLAANETYVDGGSCPLPGGWPPMAEIAGRLEMVFVDGAAMTQVLSRSQMTTGTFLVDVAGRQVLLWP